MQSYNHYRANDEDGSAQQRQKSFRPVSATFNSNATSNYAAPVLPGYYGNQGNQDQTVDPRQLVVQAPTAVHPLSQSYWPPLRSTTPPDYGTPLGAGWNAHSHVNTVQGATSSAAPAADFYGQPRHSAAWSSTVHRSTRCTSRGPSLSKDPGPAHHKPDRSGAGGARSTRESSASEDIAADLHQQGNEGGEKARHICDTILRSLTDSPFGQITSVEKKSKQIQDPLFVNGVLKGMQHVLSFRRDPRGGSTLRTLDTPAEVKSSAASVGRETAATRRMRKMHTRKRA